MSSRHTRRSILPQLEEPAASDSNIAGIERTDPHKLDHAPSSQAQSHADDSSFRSTPEDAEMKEDTAQSNDQVVSLSRDPMPADERDSSMSPDANASPESAAMEDVETKETVEADVVMSAPVDVNRDGMMKDGDDENECSEQMDNNVEPSDEAKGMADISSPMRGEKEDEKIDADHPVEEGGSGENAKNVDDAMNVSTESKQEHEAAEQVDGDVDAHMPEDIVEAEPGKPNIIDKVTNNVCQDDVKSAVPDVPREKRLSPIAVPVETPAQGVPSVQHAAEKSAVTAPDTAQFQFQHQAIPVSAREDTNKYIQEITSAHLETPQASPNEPTNIPTMDDSPHAEHRSKLSIPPVSLLTPRNVQSLNKDSSNPRTPQQTSKPNITLPVCPPSEGKDESTNSSYFSESPLPSPNPPPSDDEEQPTPSAAEHTQEQSPQTPSVHVSPGAEAIESSNESQREPEPTPEEDMAFGSSIPSPISPASQTPDREHQPSPTVEDISDSDSKPSDDDGGNALPDASQSGSEPSVQSAELLDQPAVEDQLSSSDNDADVDIGNTLPTASSPEQRSTEEQMHHDNSDRADEPLEGNDVPIDTQPVIVLSNSSGEDADVDSERDSEGSPNPAGAVEEDRLSPDASANSSDRARSNSLSDISSSAGGRQNQIKSDTLQREESPRSTGSVPSVVEDVPANVDRATESPTQPGEADVVAVVDGDQAVLHDSEVDKIEQDSNEEMEISRGGDGAVDQTAVQGLVQDIDQSSNVQLKMDPPMLATERLLASPTIDVVEQNQPLVRNQEAKLFRTEGQISDSRGAMLSTSGASQRNMSLPPTNQQARIPNDTAAVILQTRAALSKLRQERAVPSRNDSVGPHVLIEKAQASQSLTMDAHRSASQTSAPVGELLAPPPSPSPQNLQLPPPRPGTSKSKFDFASTRTEPEREVVDQGNVTLPNTAYSADSKEQKGMVVAERDEVEIGRAGELKDGGIVQAEVDDIEVKGKHGNGMKRGLVDIEMEGRAENPSKRRKHEPLVVPFSGMPSMEQTLNKLRSGIALRTRNNRDEQSGLNRSLNFESMRSTAAVSILDRLARIEARELDKNYKPLASICRKEDNKVARSLISTEPAARLFHEGSRANKKGQSLAIDRSHAKMKRKLNIAQLSALSSARASKMADNICGWRLKPSPFQDRANILEVESGNKRPFVNDGANDGLLVSKESCLKKRRK